jgi:predicted phosphodiesterase
MRIQVVSDLHLEFGDIEIPNTEAADVLILSGDIMVAQDLHDHPEADTTPMTEQLYKNMGRRQANAYDFRNFLKRCSLQFPNVVYIPGNHEYYHGKFPDGAEYLKEECAKFNNVHFLEMDTVTIDDVTFIGGTLWTDMNNGDPLTMHSIGDMMNDFRIIKNSTRNYARFSPIDAATRHRNTVEYIRTVIEGKFDQKFVVAGHHAPSRMSTHAQYKDQHLMNGGYSSELSDFIMDHPQIKLWTHGHTHHQFDYMIGSTRIVCNPRGYINYEACADTFNPYKVVEV